jgi:integrase
MAKTIEKLSDLKLRGLKKPGFYSDGDRLYFRVASAEARGWILRYTLHGKSRDMGLGSYPEISLASARERAKEARELVSQGVDPIDARAHQRAAAREEEAERRAREKPKTFDDCVRGYIRSHEAEWSNAKHRAQWAKTIATYASPVFGKLPVAKVDQALVLKALEPIWRDKVETASRVRGRIEAVLGWATAHGYRTGDNPASWVRLKHLLPKKSKVRKVEHFRALPYEQIGAFVAEIRKSSDLAARCLELVILTAVRTNEALGARWDEFDFKAKTWTIPGSRTKTGKEHRVPLSAPAVELLERLHKSRQDGEEFVFPGRGRRAPLSDGAMLMMLERMGRGDVTVHGFRSTFRDWAGEATSHANHVVEQALAHAIGSAVEAAYRRGDLFEKRRLLMDEWAAFCGEPRGDVVPFKKQRQS